MDNPEELLSRLNAKTQSYAIQVQGARTTFDPFHIAAAIGMAKAPEGAKYLARVRYAGQIENASKVTYELFTTINIKYHDRKQKKSYRSGLFTDMAMLAVKEYVISDICKSCHGAGSAIIDSKKVDCPSCYGLGIVLGLNQARSANLGINRATWHKSGWARIYGEMLDTLAKWDRDICLRLRL